MKAYFVKTNNVEDLKSALGRMIEYTKFLEEDTGRNIDSYLDIILEETEIDVEVVDQKEMTAEEIRKELVEVIG